MNTQMFERRFLFTGTLALKTGLHIGSGWAVGTPSDSPIVRTPDGRPFIPGSSFKGAFRSAVEKLTPATGLKSCRLMAGQGCPGAQGEEQRAFNQERAKENWSGETLFAQLQEKLCHTCKLFGSPYRASRIYFSDLLPPDEGDLASRMIQIRDGVAIDRDSEKAVDRLKYDYEVVAPAQTFQLQIFLEDPSPEDLALTSLGLFEFISGLAYLGGKRSRGLGNCQIQEPAIYCLDLAAGDEERRAERLRNYLLKRTPAEKMTQVEDASGFLEQQIKTLPIFKGENHAQATDK